MPDKSKKETSIPLVEMRVEQALWTFVHNINSVFSRKAIISGQAFLGELNANKDSAWDIVFSHADEARTVRSTMAACTNLKEMKRIFDRSGLNVKKLLMLHLVRFLEWLQGFPQDGVILFPEKPIDMIRYFLVGQWPEDSVKYPKSLDEEHGQKGQ